jgi:hypothetical protein
MINQQALLPFESKYCRVVLDDGFVLSGTIVKVYDDFITLKSDQKTGLIHFERLREVYPITRRDNFDY